jgi:hypothetical protein
VPDDSTQLNQIAAALNRFAPATNPHISQTERTELKTATRISFPQPVVGRRF